MRIAAFLLVLAFTLRAQQDETGVGEITGFFGGVTGIDTHPAGGFTFASPTSRHLVPYLEVCYASLGTYDFRSGFLNGTANLRQSRMYDLNGGVHVRFPNRTHAVPYIGAGIGLLRFSSDLESAALSGNTTVHAGANYLAGNLSGGVRYYITNHVGVRPEVKGYLGNKNFIRLAVGLFYQFP